MLGLLALFATFLVFGLNIALGGINGRLDRLEDDVGQIREDISAIRVALANGGDSNPGNPRGGAGSPPPPDATELVVALAPDNPPYSFLDSTTGRWEGVDVELTRELARRIGFRDVRYRRLDSLSALYEQSVYVWAIGDFGEAKVEPFLTTGWQAIAVNQYWEPFGAFVPSHGLIVPPDFASAAWNVATNSALDRVSTDAWRVWAEQLAFET